MGTRPPEAWLTPAGPRRARPAPRDGVAEGWGPGGTRREQPGVDLVTGEVRNTLAPGELLRAIRLPDHALRSRTAFRRLSLSNLGRSGVLLLGRVDPPDAGGAFVLTVTASTRRPVQLRFAADALPTAADLVATLDAAIPADLYHDDIHGLPEWRRDMTYRLGEQIRAELVDGTTSDGGLR